MNVIHLPDINEGEDKSSPFKNCIRKNYRHIRKWAKRTKTDCFRLYDRHIHHYPLAIDYYAGRVCVQYFAPNKISEIPSKEFQEEVEQVLSELLKISKENIYWKTRAKSKETRQYEKLDHSKEFFIAHEYGVKFKINILNYLDTGLFLDHRETRQIVALASKGKKLLNLFAYTCSFSVQAAVAGACFTKSVDMSNTYTAWGRENFNLNELPAAKNDIVRADCLKFLQQEKEKYDVIIIDPPTISRSKKMDQLFDVHEDYIFLIEKSLELLLPQGMIFFSTNSRKFNFNENAFQGCKIIDISAKTIPIDFHDPKIHRCFKIQKK